MRVVIVTNIPAPYRIPVYEALDAADDIDLTVLYCAAREPNRYWRLPATPVRHLVLRGMQVRFRGKSIHLNPGVARALDRIHPDVVITTGYNPTHLFAVAHCARRGIPHVVQTDGTVSTEQVLGAAHRLARRLVQRVSAAFVGASDGSLDLFRSWGVPESALFRSVLAVDNDRFRHRGTTRYDLLFSGQLIPAKNPLFAVEVAAAAAAQLGRAVRLAIAGTGPLEAEVRGALERTNAVDGTLLGFVQQEDLPEVYGSARLLLFPTAGDAWGIVANEASASGVPVITTPEAGAVGELVVDGATGRVLPLDVDRWAHAVADLLGDDQERRRLGDAARVAVERCTFQRAADGLRAAARHSVGTRRPRILIDMLGAPARSGGMRLHATEILRQWLSDWGSDDLVVVGGPWIRQVPGIERARRVITWPNDGPVARAAGQHLLTPIVYRLTRRHHLLATNSVLSRFSDRRTATVVAHDWRHVLHPEEFSTAQRLYRRWWRRSARRAERVVCVSEKTRAESLRILGRTDPVVIENGRDHAARWTVLDARPEVAPRGPYVVTFGHHTNKRPQLAIEAFAAGAAPGLSLVVLGARGVLRDELEALALDRGIAQHVHLPGFVLEHDYQWLVAHAEAVVVASSDEGFGLPLAEAASLGVPAVVARDCGVAAMFEDTAIVVDPTPEDLSRGIREALQEGTVDGSRAGNSWADVVQQLRAVVLGEADGAARVRSPRARRRAPR